ncbi:MAG: hypothetical protein FWE36_06655 [Erysipelotrichales bacterium]|nr:hypothetical protein [Erysipelotrichales bacterium]
MTKTALFHGIIFTLTSALLFYFIVSRIIIDKEERMMINNFYHNAAFDFHLGNLAMPQISFLEEVENIETLYFYDIIQFNSSQILIFCESANLAHTPYNPNRLIAESPNSFISGIYIDQLFAVRHNLRLNDQFLVNGKSFVVAKIFATNMLFPNGTAVIRATELNQISGAFIRTSERQLFLNELNEMPRGSLSIDDFWDIGSYLYYKQYFSHTRLIVSTRQDFSGMELLSFVEEEYLNLILLFVAIFFTVSFITNYFYGSIILGMIGEKSELKKYNNTSFFLSLFFFLATMILLTLWLLPEWQNIANFQNEFALIFAGATVSFMVNHQFNVQKYKLNSRASK